jgi:hypothetical protein
MSSGHLQWSDGHGSWVTPGGHANGQMVIGQISGQAAIVGNSRQFAAILR